MAHPISCNNRCVWSRKTCDIHSWSPPHNYRIIYDTFYNSRPIINTKIFTPTEKPTCSSPLTIWTNDTIISSLSITFQKIEVEADTWHFNDRLGINLHHLNLYSGLWCAIIFTVTLKILPIVTCQWPIKNKQRLINVIKCDIGKWVVQSIRY